MLKIKRKCNENTYGEEKEMIPLTHEENKFYEEQEESHISEEKFVWIKMMKIIKVKEKLKIIVITQEGLEELFIVNAI